MPEEKENFMAKNIFLKAYSNGEIVVPDKGMLEQALDWRQSENVAEQYKPCEHGSISGTKADCPICFYAHFFHRTTRN